MNILFIDSETTGIYQWKQPMEHPSQPHLVQLGAVLHDANKHVRASLNLIIKPNGWEIPAEAAAVHGITTEIAHQYGVPLVDALEMLSGLAEMAGLVVAHNTDFDIPVFGAQYHRAGLEDPFLNRSRFCTMKASTNICRIPGPRGFKWPKLEEAHRHFTGEGFDNAHDAMADVLACARVYYHLADLAVVA